MTENLPANQECERSILGAVLLDNSAYFQAAILDPDSFSLDSHKRIFLRMSELAERGEPIDFNTLTVELGKHKEIEQVGGANYVCSLTDGLPRVKHIAQYVKIVNDKAMLRKLIHTCNSSMAAAYDQAESAQSIIGRVVDDILKLQAGGAEDPKRISEFSGEVTAKLMREWQDPNSVERYTLGVPGLTAKTGGMLNEEYGVIMGRTGDGKTGLALQIALENGLRGKPVVFFSLELSKETMLKRAYCQLAKVSNSVVIKHTQEPLDGEIERIAYAKKVLDEAPIFFDDPSRPPLAQVLAKARQMIRRHGAGMVVVDYIQKIDAKYKDMQSRMTAISEGLRTLAKDEHIRVLALSQMGRPEGKNMNARPTKFDPKESGSIENDVHLLISAYRPVDDHKMPTGADELIICKQRDGESAIENVQYRGEIYTFVPRMEVQ